MADTVESTPVELNVEGQALKEKSCAPAVLEAVEKGACTTKACEVKDKTVADSTDGTEASGIKRKSDEAENEDEEDAKKVKKGEEGETKEKEKDATDGVVNGSEAEKTTETTEESNGKTHTIPEDEVVKKVVAEETPAEEATASS